MKIKQEIDSAITYYEYGCKKIAEAFRNKYFEPDTEIWWVGDDVTDVCNIGDYWFCPEDMLGYLRNKYTIVEMFKRYDLALDYATKYSTSDGFYNIKNWLAQERFANKNKFK